MVLSEALLKHFQPPGSKTPVTYENPFQSFESGEALVSEAANVLKSIDPGISSILESCCEPDVSRRLFADEAADAVHQIQSTALIQAGDLVLLVRLLS